MSKQERRSAILIGAAVVIGAGLAAAGSVHSVQFLGIGAFAWAVAAALLVQWVVFVSSQLAGTDRFFDLTGSLTYLTVTLGLALTIGQDARGVLLAAMISLWALRLGTFLFTRVSKSGGDDRFKEILQSPLRHFGVWTVQGLWVSMTASAAWIALTSLERRPLGWLGWLGLAIWMVGFVIEVVADEQKRRFKADESNSGRFISTGLWAHSRHPNYFGEIMLWLGVALVALPVARLGARGSAVADLRLAAAHRVSGVPLLEAKADDRWGGEPDYEEYKRTTPVLVPRP